MSLFDFDFRYPDAPGFKDGDTSRKAAESMVPTASLLRGKCLTALRQNGPLTADECAALLDMSVLSIRPRFSELLATDHIRDTGLRRANASMRSAKVWVLA